MSGKPRSLHNERDVRSIVKHYHTTAKVMNYSCICKEKVKYFSILRKREGNSQMDCLLFSK